MFHLTVYSFYRFKVNEQLENNVDSLGDKRISETDTGELLMEIPQIVYLRIQQIQKALKIRFRFWQPS